QRLSSILGKIGIVTRPHARDALARGPDAPMADPREKPLDRPHVLARKAPIVGIECAQVDDGEAGDAGGRVDIRIEVAQRQRARTSKNRLAPMQARITRSGDRTPAAALAIDEDDVIEIVHRFKGHEQGWISMLLQHAGRKQRCFTAMRFAVPQYLPEASERL